MSKGLEALENIKGNCDLFDEGYQWDNEFSKQFDEDLDTIEKELKDKADQDRALKLIIEKGVDMELLKKCGNAVSYNSNVYAPQTLKIDDFVFLKEFVSKYGTGGD